MLNVLVHLSSSFGLGFASYFFRTQGVEFYKIMLVWAIAPLVSLPIVVLCNNWNTRKYLGYGIVSYTGMALSLLAFNRYSFLLFGVFHGLVLGYFWVSFNYIFFLKSTNNEHARDVSIYFIIGPLIGIILPPLGALVIHNASFKALFIITSLLSLLPLFYTQSKHFDYRLNLSFREANQSFKGLRLIAFYNNALHYFQDGFLPVYVLLFLKTEYQVGALMSYLALLSLVVSFGLAYASDKLKRRVEILYPLMILMAALIMIMPSLKNLAPLVTLIGIYAIVDNLSQPIRFAIPMDMRKTDIGFWRAGEFYGNVGRVIVFSVSSLLIYLGNYWLPFVIFALLAVSFPFIASQKTKSLRRSASP
ncbi:MAG TPA: MFS transporter [Candidatus Saccharimonadales bacterium]|nr:MFS transporter [Candidatus Saccharimonadales bacterium]